MSTIGPYCNTKNIYVHVDAAYAGSAFICPEFQHYLEGIESADSFCFNPHKWLLTSYDCCTMWFKDKSLMMDNYNTDSIYVQSNGLKSLESLRNCSIQFTRKFRGLKLWMVMKVFGVEYLQEYIRHHIKLTKEFEAFVHADNRFEIIQEVVMGLVCFRLRGDNSLTEKLLEKIYERREIFLIQSVIKGTFFLRFAIGSNYINANDIEFIWNHIKSLADEFVMKDD